jgi:hypothetical protein
MANAPSPFFSWGSDLSKGIALTHERVLAWLVPGLLAGTVSALVWIGSNIADIRTSLGVAVFRIEDHERRIDNLEALFLPTTPKP